MITVVEFLHSATRRMAALPRSVLPASHPAHQAATWDSPGILSCLTLASDKKASIKALSPSPSATTLILWRRARSVREIVPIRDVNATSNTTNYRTIGPNMSVKFDSLYTESGKQQVTHRHSLVTIPELGNWRNGLVGRTINARFKRQGSDSPRFPIIFPLSFS
jgi:hypothetical protein